MSRHHSAAKHPISCLAGSSDQKLRTQHKPAQHRHGTAAVNGSSALGFLETTPTHWGAEQDSKHFLCLLLLSLLPFLTVAGNSITNVSPLESEISLTGENQSANILLHLWQILRSLWTKETHAENGCQRSWLLGGVGVGRLL